MVGHVRRRTTILPGLLGLDQIIRLIVFLGFATVGFKLEAQMDWKRRSIENRNVEIRIHDKHFHLSG
jgi:hypothetical protein